MSHEDVNRLLAAVRESTGMLLTALSSLTDGDVREPSLLPGWSRAHVLTHLARNADGMAGTFDGAIRGVAVPIYPGGDGARDQAIADGAGRDAATLRADVTGAADRLDETWSRMDAEAWTRTVPGRRGDLPAYDLLAGRWREVEIHRVDLDHGYRPDSWPAAFVAYLLDHLVGPGLPGRLPDGVSLELSATDTGAAWTVGQGARRLGGTGPAWALASWLAGRGGPARGALEGDLPDLAPWS